MAFNDKQFLDYQGLSQYDLLIKEYIKTTAGDSETVQNLVDDMKVLKGDAEVTGSVDQKVNDAISALVGQAPETLDTLKEIADWISKEGDVVSLVDKVAGIDEKVGAPATEATDETEATEATGLFKDVEDLEDSIAKTNAQVLENTTNIKVLEENQQNLLEYIDEQDKAVYESIVGIEELKIAALFATKQGEEESAADAIAAVEAGKAVVLTADQTIAEDITITKECYIDANGSTFTGTVTVPTGANVMIENATFAKPVVVA